MKTTLSSLIAALCWLTVVVWVVSGCSGKDGKAFIVNPEVERLTAACRIDSTTLRTILNPDSIEGFEQLSSLSAQAWILVDDSSGMIISQKYADEPRPIASLTKMMTCLLALENGVMKDTVSINPINWKRDETYAPASENKGSLRPNKETGEYEISTRSSTTTSRTT